MKHSMAGNVSFMRWLIVWNFNLDEHHALAPRNNLINEGEEYVEAEQNVISGTFGMSNDVLPLSMHIFSANNTNKVNKKKK